MCGQSTLILQAGGSASESADANGGAEQCGCGWRNMRRRAFASAQRGGGVRVCARTGALHRPGGVERARAGYPPGPEFRADGDDQLDRITAEK